MGTPKAKPRAKAIREMLALWVKRKVANTERPVVGGLPNKVARRASVEASGPRPWARSPGTKAPYQTGSCCTRPKATTAPMIISAPQIRVSRQVLRAAAGQSRAKNRATRSKPELRAP